MSKKESNEGTGKEVAVGNEYAVSSDLAAEMQGMGLGAGEEIDNKDILIPKLMLTQGLTKAVAKGKAKVGRYINSISLKDMGDNLEALVIQSYKVWQEYKIVPNGKDEYLQTLDYYGNEELPYQFKDEKGNDCKRKEVLGFYCLLLNEIAEGMAFPYIIDFKGASKPAGRELSTHFAKLRQSNLPSFAKVFTFGTELVEDEHTYYVKTVDMGRNITKPELDAVKSWVAELKTNKEKYRVDDSEEKEVGDADEPVTVDAEVVNETAGKKKF